MSTRPVVYWFYMTMAWLCYAISAYRVMYGFFDRAAYMMALATFWLVMAGPYRAIAPAVTPRTPTEGEG